MLRPSRPLTIALLWLAIVLLPVRAWASAAMPLAMVGEAVSQMQTDPAEHSIASMPCHGTSAPDDTAGPQACSMCDVCHGAFAGLPSACGPLATVPTAVPCATAGPPMEPAVLTGPERPPRTVLA
jgi:hypothetical protein